MTVRERIAETLNELPFVRWDRLVRDGEKVRVYGWISRSDGRSDFVLVDFRPDGEWFEWVTSSPRYERQITEALEDAAPVEEGHRCERVEYVFRGLVEGAIRIER